MVNNSMILAGAIPAAVLALLLDLVFARLEKSLSPPR
jgi:ABC-type proline/glycine betaine transport system permease subunit